MRDIVKSLRRAAEYNSRNGMAWELLDYAAGEIDRLRTELQQHQWRSIESAPEGWKLVPTEPTEGMMEAYQDEQTVGGGYHDTWMEFRSGYHAMLYAAPKPPEPDQ